MKKALTFIVLVLLCLSSTNAQTGSRIDIGFGPALGDSKEYFSFSLQGDYYYLWNVSENVNIGLTTGVIVYLGEGDNAGEANFGSIPDVYLPVAIATRINLSEAFTFGADLGFGINLNAFDDTGGFYFRPVLAYNLKENVSLFISYSSISERESTASSLNFGINFGFKKTKD